MQHRFMIIVLKLLISILARQMSPDWVDAVGIVPGEVGAIRDAKKLIADLEQFSRR